MEAAFIIAFIPFWKSGGGVPCKPACAELTAAVVGPSERTGCAGRGVSRAREYALSNTRL